MNQLDSMASLKPKDLPLAALFDCPSIDSKASIRGYEGMHSAIPQVCEYEFAIGEVRDMIAFWGSPFKALKLEGDPGTGKTSLIEQWHARLNWPLYKVSCSRSTEASRLIGRLVPTVSGDLKWIDGPVVRAAKEGTSVLLDEYNTMDPDQATGLNMLLEGYSITIEETGEVVTPLPGFRVFATENPLDSKLAITGRNVQDAANDDRWMVVQIDYMSEEMEFSSLSKAMLAANVDAAQVDLFALTFVKVANKIRLAYRQGQDSIEKPMSTRALKRWAILNHRYQKTPNPLIHSLVRAFRMPDEMLDAVTLLVNASFGVSSNESAQKRTA